MPVPRRRRAAKRHTVTVEGWVWDKANRCDPDGRRNGAYLRHRITDMVAGWAEPEKGTAPAPSPAPRRPVVKAPPSEPIPFQIRRTKHSRHDENWAVNAGNYETLTDLYESGDRILVDLCESDGRLRYQWMFDPDQLDDPSDGVAGRQDYHLLRCGELCAVRAKGIKRV